MVRHIVEGYPLLYADHRSVGALEDFLEAAVRGHSSNVANIVDQEFKGIR